MLLSHERGSAFTRSGKQCVVCGQRDPVNEDQRCKFCHQLDFDHWREMAGFAFNIPIAKVSKEQRLAVKTLVFSFLSALPGSRENDSEIRAEADVSKDALLQRIYDLMTADILNRIRSMYS